MEKQKILRKTTMSDLPAVMNIYAQARTFMGENGNPEQWGIVHPPQTTIEEDIRLGKSYVCTLKNGGHNENHGEKILATFFFSTDPDPTYTKIDGTWINATAPYGVVHRIARATNDSDSKGTGEFCLNWCFEQIPNIRIDTHVDNAPMLKLMEKLNFVRCGIIWLENGNERIAFQKIS